VALDDKYDGLQKLVQMGKEKGYVLYDDVSEALPGDISTSADLDHHDVRLRSEPPHPRAHASRRGHLALALELDPPHTRSMTEAIAWPKPMHIVATP